MLRASNCSEWSAFFQLLETRESATEADSRGITLIPAPLHSPRLGCRSPRPPMRPIQAGGRAATAPGRAQHKFDWAVTAHAVTAPGRTYHGPGSTVHRAVAVRLPASSGSSGWRGPRRPRSGRPSAQPVRGSVHESPRVHQPAGSSTRAGRYSGRSPVYPTLALTLMHVPMRRRPSNYQLSMIHG
jgi:hypothetical protein